MNEKPLSNKIILAIDDADSIRSFLRISMEAHGATFYEADTAQKGLELAGSLSPDLIVLDLGLPDRDGLEILPDLKAMTHDPEVIILSVREEREVREQAKSLGADNYLSKPFTMDDLMDAILDRMEQPHTGKNDHA